MDGYNEKIKFFRNIIDNIQKGLQNSIKLNIITNNDYNSCLESLEKIINLLNTINPENILGDLQYVNNSLSACIKNYGIYNFEYLINICLDNNYANNVLTIDNIEKYNLINKYLHPLSYKIQNWTSKTVPSSKEVIKNKIIDENMIISGPNLECYDLARTHNQFNMRVYGIKVVLHDFTNKKSIIINCVYDDIILNNLNNNYIRNKINSIKKMIDDNSLSKNELFDINSWNNYINNLSLKELLIYSNNELFNKYISIMNQISGFLQKTIDVLVDEFIGCELYGQRNIIINLLLNDSKPQLMYIAYLLYDILSDEKSASTDTNEQKLLYNSLSWNCKKYFKNAMSKTIEYTTTLLNYDNSKIPLEQQICLMKTSNNVKEKAMQKLKELKSKSEDSGSKARQYLDGLLKIPFSVYKEEYILKKKYDINTIFLTVKNLLNNIDINTIDSSEIKEFFILLKDITINKNYNNIEILNIISIIENNQHLINDFIIQNFKYTINNKIKKKDQKLILKCINSIIIFNELQEDKIIMSDNINNSIINFIDKYKNNNFIKELFPILDSIINKHYFTYLINIEKYVNSINSKNSEIIEYINNFNNILDSAVYGHKNAKNQIERILGQWINGEKSGYCFGFEGPPGVGKTSLAKKGIANCLKDTDGKPRPFSFIAIGGSSNGSTLDGHNYTYVGSTWGKIVDLLIEHKCMNPIIFIDELDKVSKTEHGKEIIGILTHLVDTTQNSSFQDKYFSNIDLDLSKALFIFSYNDVDQIDKILLDRIHRIKFDNLLLDDKIVISKKHLLPELYRKFSLENIINIDTTIIHYIIENYTNESGVRKLKEILFEIISSINLDLLKKSNKFNIPVVLTIEIVDNILNERSKSKYLKINNIPKIGIINGMWANAYGNSGILHIECNYTYSSSLFDLKLTGMQGDVMKESMNVAKTVVLGLIKDSELKKLVKSLEDTKLQGLHIHVPEGATPKDGPSAGAAITIVLYSLLTKKKIKNDVAITGEICLQGKITAIGGLDLKIIGGIRAGIKTFLYPKENAKDFKLFCEKYKQSLDEYEFFEVSNIEEAIKYVII
jgi:ATP-dependent Lon protease